MDCWTKPIDPSQRELSLVSWLVGSRRPVSPAIQAQLEAGLFKSLPILLGGALNTVAIAAIGAWRHPTTPFLVWLALEVTVCLARLPVTAIGRAALRRGKNPPVTVATVLSCAWAASIGFGAFISIRTEDWLLTTVVCTSVTAMVSGVCLRNFGTPRLAALMVILMLAPCALAALLASHAVLSILSIQFPIYLLAIFSSAFALQRLLVSRMTALDDLQQSEVLNRSLLQSSPDYTLILDDLHQVVFCNRPSGPEASLIGADWLNLLPADDRAMGERVLASVAEGKQAKLTTRHVDAAGTTLWFDVIANPILDGSGRTMIVARDITHQKVVEAQAIWTARHDPLTGLANRSVLQDELEKRFDLGGAKQGSALLIVDIDHFKAINDTLGHDAGDALLRTFADRLRASVQPSDLTSRIGGDEFAIVTTIESLADVEGLASRIYANLAEPLLHQGRALECSASIGASILVKDGHDRTEVMKAADIALYAAKAGGRGQLKLFDHNMKEQVDRQHAMVTAARLALREGRVEPFYQPKVQLGTSEIIGFEALLRWTDDYEALRDAKDLSWAFEDPKLATELGERMIQKVLDQVQLWTKDGIAFGHVAINVTAAEFRRSGFADEFLRRITERNINPSLLQLEITESVFLESDAAEVEAALQTLSRNGICIALDDFGTGYASLSHLKQFPVELLKIDGALVRKLGGDAEVEAIVAAVINLGHCLGMRIVAEGVENYAQRSKLIQLGCDAAQGFLYSGAIPAEEVPRALASAVPASRLRA